MISLIEKLKAGTKLNDFAKVGRLKDHLSKVKIRVPALNFSIKNYCSELWEAFWNGQVLPFRFKINGKIVKETLWARVTFGSVFIVADSLYLVGKSVVWIINKIGKTKGFSGWNMLMVAGCVVGFLGWVFPMWLEFTGFMQEIADTHTMKAIGEVEIMTPVPDINIQLPSVGWLGITLLIASPFSWLRFRKFQGVRSKLKKSVKPIIGDDE